MPQVPIAVWESYARFKALELRREETDLFAKALEHFTETQGAPAMDTAKDLSLTIALLRKR